LFRDGHYERSEVVNFPPEDAPTVPGGPRYLLRIRDASGEVAEVHGLTQDAD
jgi:hypothetical protein